MSWNTAALAHRPVQSGANPDQPPASWQDPALAGGIGYVGSAERVLTEQDATDDGLALLVPEPSLLRPMLSVSVWWSRRYCAFSASGNAFHEAVFFFLLGCGVTASSSRTAFQARRRSRRRSGASWCS